MKIVYFLLLLSVTSFAFADKVFVCKSSTSVAYHAKKTCRGIKNCTPGGGSACKNGYGRV